VKLDLLLETFGSNWRDVRGGALAAERAGFDGIRVNRPRRNALTTGGGRAQRQQKARQAESLSVTHMHSDDSDSVRVPEKANGTNQLG
jgi:hypothetical protein